MEQINYQKRDYDKYSKMVLDMVDDENYLPTFKEAPEVWDILNSDPDTYYTWHNENADNPKREAFRSALDAHIIDLEEGLL